MRHCLHHLAWLWRRFRLVLVLYALFWVVLTAVAWFVPADSEAEPVFVIATVLLFIWAGLMLIDVERHDPCLGTDSFWLTRPPRWRSVWMSHVMFLLLFLAGPPALCWIFNGLMLGNGPGQWLWGSVDLLAFAGPLTVLGAMATFSRGWYSFVVALAAALACFFAGWESFAPDDLKSWQWLRPSLVCAGVLMITLLAAWAGGLRRAAFPWRAGITGAALFLLPLSTRLSIEDATPSGSIVEADWAHPGEPVPADAFDAGVLIFRGIPADTVPVLRGQQTSLNFFAEHTSDPRKSGLLLGDPIWLDRAERGTARGEPTAQLSETGRKLQTLVPPGTHWYRDGASIDLSKRFVASERQTSGLTGRLVGTTGGVLLAPKALVTTGLSEGSAAADCGTRICIKEVRAQNDRLSGAFEIRQTVSLTAPIPPGGFGGGDPSGACGAPVLYFPSVPMAMLLTRLAVPLQFRSLQTGVQHIPFDIVMPDSEKLRGIRFTPEVLQGAKLLFCAAAVRGSFTVKLPDRNITFPGTSAVRFDDSDIRFFASMPDDADGRRARLQWLEKQGPDIVRAVIREYSKPQTDPRKIPAGPQYYEGLPGFEPENFLPELKEAIPRVHEWMDMAWMNGLESRLAGTALAVLKDTRLPLPESVLAAAAAIAQPADYPRLQHHVRNAFLWFRGETGFSGAPPGETLWKRLRALPGFDWRTVARERWQRAFQSTKGTAAVQIQTRNAAALAGDSDALNQLLEVMAATKYDGGIEWKELDPLIEGLPPEEPERRVWLLENAGKFLWDNGTGKYRSTPKSP